jgi:Ser/Thr protein kinase RdoA (MazF antagonist)
MLPGGKSDHYRLIAGSGEYAIRRSHRSKTSADIRFEHDLVAHLRDRGFLAPWGGTHREQGQVSSRGGKLLQRVSVHGRLGL